MEHIPTQPAFTETKVETKKDKPLRDLFCENFNPERSFRLEKDIDQDNNEVEIGNREIFWTELKNPETGETVEGKLYRPKEGDVKKVLIISPGYKGDFVLQESKYANDFAENGRAVLVLRHNALKVEGEGAKNYVHCPERSELNKKESDKYLGKGNFSFDSANREVLTALKALNSAIEKIDIIGHSWGGRISLLSINDINQESGSSEVAKEIARKIDNLILIGAWLETREENLKPFLDYFKNEAEAGYFKNMDPEEVVESAIKSGAKLKKMSNADFPEQMRIVGIQSVGDEDVDMEGEYLEFFKQLKGRERIGSTVLKDLKQLMVEKIGDREAETHDYALTEVKKWVGQIIK
ncbi:MAG: hypothetical protein NTY33_01475 [Candidatus Moranbacteria bacterium]|nr:hypothetical protein [Candidatus Moranbacteria bacterium]